MTPEEFKKKYPQYANLEGDALWNKMEDILLETGDLWTADYSEGDNVLPLGTNPDGIEAEYHVNKFWINDKTGERITNEELEKRRMKGHSKISDNISLESFSFDIIDFGKLEEQ